MTPCSGCGYYTMHSFFCPLKPKPPKWRCWNPDEGDAEDGRTEEAYDPETAATQFAESQCSDDPDYYSIYENDSRPVHVTGDDGKVHKFHVRGEMTMNFSADEDTD
jgi:hypothetical protein